MTITLNGKQRDIAAPANVADLVALLTQSNAGCAVALNDEVVPRAEWAARPVADGDRVEVLNAVQGG